MNRINPQSFDTYDVLNRYRTCLSPWPLKKLTQRQDLVNVTENSRGQGGHAQNLLGLDGEALQLILLRNVRKC